MRITRKSSITGVERTRDIPLNPEDFLAWDKDQVSIEEAMPYLNSVDREFILSGIVPSEWTEAFREVEVAWAI